MIRKLLRRVFSGRSSQPGQAQVVPRSRHGVSRDKISSAARRTITGLQEKGYAAFVVGGAVRDLLLGLEPKDFDIATDATPEQVRATFRRSRIIGRRFRLVHVMFGDETVEVSTYRARHGADPAEGSSDEHGRILRDNVFGNQQEDASRRDFTINALFYDIGTYSIIDYVGGLQDLKDGLIRCIGDPNERFQEDPVRMLRAIVFASRLGFRLDKPIIDAIATHRELLGTASPARMIEEYYKILRSGYAEQTFRTLAEHRLLDPVTPEIQRGTKNDGLWSSLAALDVYRRKFDNAPVTMRNPVLLGTVLIPLGLMPRNERPRWEPEPDAEHEDDNLGNLIQPKAKPKFRRPPKEPILKIGMLPIARGDTERLRQILSLQSRLADVEMSPRAKRALMHRGPFEDSLTWFEIHGNAAAVVEHWKGFIEAVKGEPPQAAQAEGEGEPGGDGQRKRRRRRGRRRRGGPGFKKPES